MLTLEELHAHYKAVRSRLDNPVVKKKEPAVRLIHPEPQTYPDPLDNPPPEPVEPLPVVEAVTPAPVHSPIPETPALTILREVSEKHGMSVKQIQSAARMKTYVAARQEAAYRLNTELTFSLAQIGRMLGKRDHTTILHAINRHKKNLAKGDEPWARQVAFTDACDTET
jgi:hypothetical protein